MSEPQSEPSRWGRAAVLLGIFWMISVNAGVPAAPLIALPLLAQLTFLPRPRSGPALMAALASAVLVFAGPVDGLWYFVRGWGTLLGLSFVALTLFAPAASFLSRALGAVGTAALLAWGLLQLDPSQWQVVDWLVGERIATVGTAALELVRSIAQERTATPALLAAVARMIEWQISLYPGMLMVASLCGLAVAWWLYVRVAQGSDRALGPLRDFRFSNEWVWVAIAAVALTLWGTADGLGRAGANALVFMAALYVARGAAVVVFLTGGVSIGGVALTIVGLALLPWVSVGLALTIGLSDTWLDIRERARAVFTG